MSEMGVRISAVHTQMRRGEQSSVTHQSRDVSLTLEWNNQRIEACVCSSTDRLRLMPLGLIESLSLSCPGWLPSAVRLPTGVN